MTYYAEIDQEGVCFAELETGGTFNKPTMIVTDGFGKVGKKYVNGVWEDYTPPAVPVTVLSKLGYMNRFTDAELAAIYTAAKSVVQVEVWLEKFKLAEFIDLTDQRTIAGVQSLEAAGLLAAGRAAEILA